MATMTVDCVAVKVDEALRAEVGYRCPICLATFDEGETWVWDFDGIRRLPFHSREGVTPTRDVPYLD